MSKAEQAANDLIEQYAKKSSFKYQEYAGAHYSTFDLNVEEIIEFALIDNQNTIDALEKIYTSHTHTDLIRTDIELHLQVQIILKSKLK